MTAPADQNIRRHAWPEGHWNWPIGVTHKHGLRCRDMLWVGGQVDIDPSGAVLRSGDLAAQIPNAMANFGKVLTELGAGLDDLVKLLVFYVGGQGLDETEIRKALAACLPPSTRTALTLVPVPALAYPGMLVEIEGYAMRGPGDERIRRRFAPYPAGASYPSVFVRGVRAGKMLFLSAHSPTPESISAHPGDILAQTGSVIAQLKSTLTELGAGTEDVVKLNRWYVGHGTEADFEPAALACGAAFSDPGPCATGIPVPALGVPGEMIRIEFVAMRGEDGSYLPRRHVWPDTLWNWTIKLPYHHGLVCDGMVFVGGQVSLDKQGRALHPDDLTAQTHVAMTHIGTILKELGADYRDVCKVTTFYSGKDDAGRLHENLSIRSSYFPDPGPATTGIPMPALAYPSMVIEIEVFAMIP